MGLPFLQISTIPSFLFILNEPFRAPWFCFLEEGEQHGTGTGVVLATVPVLEPRDRACTGSTGGHAPPKPLRELPGTAQHIWLLQAPGMSLPRSRELLGGAQGSQCGAVGSSGNARKAQLSSKAQSVHHLETVSTRNQAQRSARSPVPPVPRSRRCQAGRRRSTAAAHPGAKGPAHAALSPEHTSELLPDSDPQDAMGNPVPGTTVRTGTCGYPLPAERDDAVPTDLLWGHNAQSWRDRGSQGLPVSGV